LLGMHGSSGQTRSPRPRPLDLNGGNGLIPVSIEKPLPTLFETGTNPEVPI